MAAPSYSEDLTDIDLAEAITAWAESTHVDWDDGGAPVADADYPFIQGSFAISQLCTKATIASLLVNAGTGLTLPTDGAYFVWHIFTAPGALDVYANGGMRLMVGHDLANFYSWDVGGSNFGRNPYGGWMNQVVNPAIGSPDDTVGTPSGTQQYIGAAVRNITAIGKGDPHAVDAVRYGRGSSTFEAGESGTPATFAGFAALNDATAARWGLIQTIDGGYLYKGKMTLGTTGTAVYFSDANKSILIDNTPKVTANFNTIEVNNAGSTIIWSNVRFFSLGTASPGRLVMNANATLTWNLCQFDNMGVFGFGGVNSVCTNAAWRGCGKITANGAKLNGSSISGYTGAADTSSLVWNTATDLDGYTDDMTFVKGTNAHHAIELGVSSPVNLTIRNVTFSGFNASNAQNDSVLHLLDKGSDQTWTIGCVGCSGTVSYKKVRAGDTVNITQGVATTVHVQDMNTGNSIEGARVLIKAAAGGPKPYQASVSITRSGTTVTVVHTAHGLATNDWVVIEGCNEGEYNGAWQITYVGVDSYTYQVSTTPSSPATGTPTSTFAPIQGTTNPSGDISDTRTYSSNQPFTGVIRWASGSPVYKSQPVSGTINSSTGASLTVQMIRDD